MIRSSVHLTPMTRENPLWVELGMRYILLMDGHLSMTNGRSYNGRYYLNTSLGQLTGLGKGIMVDLSP